MLYTNFSKNKQVAILGEEAAITYYKTSDEDEKRTLLIQRNNQTKMWVSAFDKKVLRLREMFPRMEGRGS